MESTYRHHIRYFVRPCFIQRRCIVVLVSVTFFALVLFFDLIPTCILGISPKNEQMPVWISTLNADLVQLVAPEIDTVVKEPLHISQSNHESPEAVVFIITLPESFKTREAIRKTWYSWGKRFKIEILFFIGISSSNSSDISPKLNSEFETYDDIILESHIETYYTLPIKVLRAMKYFLKTYAHSDKDDDRLPFLIKVDDDVFINLPNLASHLTHVKKSRQSCKPYIGGNLYTLASPIRDPRSKFYTPYSVYPACFWPNYVGGPLYIFSGVTVRPVFEKGLSLKNALVPFEDVLLTGFVGNRGCGIEIFQVRGMYDVSWKVSKALEDETQFRDAISFSPLDGDEMMRLFNRIN